MKLALAITGASGIGLANRFIELLPDTIELHVVTSKNSTIVSMCENKKIFFHDDNNIASSISSGSFGIDKTIILPCSMNTLAKIACGIADNLPTRIASVALKERKTLILAPREMPYSTIALENMHKLSLLGAIISPPVMAYYSDIKTLEDMENFLVGKWYDALGIEHNIYKRWGNHDK
ncbi:MAG: UbiX family flavin prenyltransferase [Sulfurovaceae bacterium]|nr:UbiX family flavin prenyltransferase [Sulfurovaceae bacterium]MDD5549132.1 UbiX family flavin prenyltransferase [Sulfurovaceae bacterium]